MIVSLHDLIVRSADAGLRLQLANGAFMKGHNGPWHDEDTYVRTTAHWALLLYKAYEITNRPVYYEGAVRACDYLENYECRPYGTIFHCRQGNGKKDQSNSLIGQAWAVEPLLMIGIKAAIPRYLEIAKQTLAVHGYNEKEHLWEAVEIDGRRMGVQPTINQQIWFSTMAMICGDHADDTRLRDNAEDFFSNVPDRIRTIECPGLICHSVEVRHGYAANIRRALRRLVNDPDQRKPDPNLLALSIGYLPFILQGISLGYVYCPQHAHWGLPKFKTMLKKACMYVMDNHPYGFLEDPNNYQWSYNPVGIEMAFSLQTLGPYLDLPWSERDRRAWLRMQLAGYYDFGSARMEKNTTDPVLLSARFYEAVNLEDCRLDFGNRLTDDDGS